MRIDADVPLDVDDALMEHVHLRDKQRQGAQVRPFDGKEFARTGVQVACDGRVGRVAEAHGLGVEIGQVGKHTSGEEVVLDVMKGPMRRVAYALISEVRAYAQ